METVIKIQEEDNASGSSYVFFYSISMQMILQEKKISPQSKGFSLEWENQ